MPADVVRGDDDRRRRKDKGKAYRNNNLKRFLYVHLYIVAQCCRRVLGYYYWICRRRLRYVGDFVFQRS